MGCFYVFMLLISSTKILSYLTMLFLMAFLANIILFFFLQST